MKTRTAITPGFHPHVLMTRGRAAPTIATMTITGTRPPTRSDHISEACVSFARAAGYRDIRIVDLCAVSGVSERRVRDAFYECHGMAPTAYLRLLALRQAREVLLEGRPQRDAVSRAAVDCGFEHLSRFAARYRRAFGEAPSATVARARSERHSVAKPAKQ